LTSPSDSWLGFGTGTEEASNPLAASKQLELAYKIYLSMLIQYSYTFYTTQTVTSSMYGQKNYTHTNKKYITVVKIICNKIGCKSNEFGTE
jgi:hypothetical protein